MDRGGDRQERATAERLYERAAHADRYTAVYTALP